MNAATAVVFNEEAHTYTLDGVVLPSVTQVLRSLYDFAAVPAAVLAAKANLGKAVHSCCELDDLDDLDEASVAPAVAPYLAGYRRFKAEKLSRMVATELVVYSPLGYAGKLDLLSDIDASRWMIDWKTPLAIHPAVALQTAGYVAALPRDLCSGGPIRRGALQLKADGTYKLHEFNDPNDYPTFVSFLNVFRWRQRNGLL